MREVAVRLDQHHDAGRLGVRGHPLEALDHALQHLAAGLALRHLVAEHPDVLHAERVGEVDEPAPFVELLLPGGRVLLVHARGGAEVRDHEAERGEVLLRPCEPRAQQLGDLREVHLAGDPPQLDRGVAEPVRLVEDGPQAPGGAAQRREGDGVAFGPRARPQDGGSGEARANRGQERATTDGHGRFLQGGIIAADAPLLDRLRLEPRGDARVSGRGRTTRRRSSARGLPVSATCSRSSASTVAASSSSRAGAPTYCRFSFELVGVEKVDDAAGHARAEVEAGGPEHQRHAAGHVLEGVGLDPLHHDRAGRRPRGSCAGRCRSGCRRGPRCRRGPGGRRSRTCCPPRSGCRRRPRGTITTLPP